MAYVAQIESTRRPFPVDARRYAKCIEVSKRIRWDIDRDVIRGRKIDQTRKFLPDGLSKVDTLEFLTEAERRFLSQIQGRTYGNMFGLIERYITAKIVDVSRQHVFGDQAAFEALVRFTDEEIKHQELFRRIEHLTAPEMRPGYRFDAQANEVALLVLSKSSWSVLALTCLIEIVTQAHYRESIGPENDICPLFKDVFLFHWKEESQHAILDELEWRREDARLTAEARDDAVNDLIALAGAVDSLVQQQAKADGDYFLGCFTRPLTPQQIAQVRSTILRAYRWQYIVSGATDERFTEILGELITQKQSERISAALAPILATLS